MKTALITGNKGFIGSHLTATLEYMGVKVIGCDLKEGRDIRKRGNIPLGADICFHLAARTDARLSDEAVINGTNVIGTAQVLNIYKDRTIFASSSAVNYPETPYAISKLIGEEICKVYGARITRLCNIHGSGGHGVFERFEQDDPIVINGQGDQIRTYATVVDAVKALIDTLTFPAGAVHILHGKEMTVSQIADCYFAGKARIYNPLAKTDIIDGRQI